MFIDNMKKIVKMNKEEELGKWLFSNNGKFELLEDTELENSIKNSLASLKEKICNVVKPLFYTSVKNNNFNNVMTDYIYHPNNLLNINELEELTDDEKCKLYILILYKILFMKFEKTLEVILITYEDLKYDFNNYDNNENVRNGIVNSKKFDKFVMVVKTYELYHNDIILRYLNI